MSLISIFFIPSFYYWVDWCAYLFIGLFSIDSFGCEVPELEGGKNNNKNRKTNNVGDVLSWLCVFKKEVPICQLLVPWGALSTQASQAADPSARPEDRHWALCIEHHFFGCSIAWVGASPSHLEPQFPCFGYKDIIDLSMLFWEWLRYNAGKGFNVMAAT